VVFLFVILRQPCGATSIFDGFIFSKFSSVENPALCVGGFTEDGTAVMEDWTVALTMGYAR